MPERVSYATARTYRRPDGRRIDLWEQAEALKGLPVYFPAAIAQDPRGLPPDGFVEGVELAHYDREVRLVIVLAAGISAVKTGAQIGFGWVGRSPEDRLATVSIAGLKS